mgnify:CR=1 FL=1
MAKTCNITCCECDRCGEKEYLAEGAPTWSDWHVVTRYSVDGVKIERLFCGNCFEDYKMLMSEQDAGFNGFMGQKGGK